MEKFFGIVAQMCAKAKVLEKNKDNNGVCVLLMKKALRKFLK